MIITIDGPAGAGKTTAARNLAKRLNIPYLDTGAMYRVVTLAALQDKLDFNDEAALTELARRDEFDLELGPDNIRVILRGQDATDAIRTMEVNQHTPYVAASPGVRQILIAKQRKLAEKLGSVVTEGRDQGSAAFPDADMKFYLIADLGARAERRLAEMNGKEQISLGEVSDNLTKRDETDSGRDVAPLVKPNDAVEVDTTQLSIEGVIDSMINHLRQAGLIEEACS